MDIFQEQVLIHLWRLFRNGRIYNEEQGYCGTASSEGKDRMILVDNICGSMNDRENEWVFVGTKDKSGDEKLEWVGKTYKEIFNKQPEWGLNYQNKEYKRASICCGIKSLSRCDKLKIYQKIMMQELIMSKMKV